MFTKGHAGGNEHYAFAMSRDEFDRAFEVIKQKGVPYGDSFHTVGNNQDPSVGSGARGDAPTIYMNDPNKHLIEIRTYD